ncbi:sulfide/dihydroorotate dehydrogenase-like FAD/NAD-binding protein [Criibacterium bergeronii]|uniref:Sulfide/dihydroorotate dehydrogenase-like FAD/NAD-binding protein n=1 Tax=Criibacterium bergeronii TaxID=1871336 RepID=A0A371IJ04_9FIRM|nr:sulfide/dihydroorotate dehydrogenase-like FAD/NAD-binding protein [Criibacterium bergeronii]RDY20464.1 sulfide/dihydroorotate dehydrogenase-like FAD/NAD-binding protein [Criibacterium bergeronii]
MYKIVKKQMLKENIALMDIEAKRCAKACKIGQFVVVIIDEVGERVPLTICDFDREKGTVTIVFQTIGSSTKRLAKLNEGEYIDTFTGPLGSPSELETMSGEELRTKNIVFIGGGVGIAPIYPQLKFLHEKGIKADVILGVRNKDILIFEDELKSVAGNVYISTDDGSYGFHGNAAQYLEHLVKNEGKNYDHAVVIGPMIMMKFTTLKCKELGIKNVIVSLNSLMVDATGMCGACRVSIGGEVKFTCVDGPEFDAYKVDFDECIRRQGIYKGYEK